MLISKTAKVKMGNPNKRFVIALGLNYKEGEIIEIPTDKLWDGCNTTVLIKCDYCQDNGIENIYQVKWNKYIDNLNKCDIKKDCCKKCRQKKVKDSNLLKYGVEHANQLENMKSKIGNKNKKYNEQYVKEKLSEKGYELVGEYINANIPFKFICKKHQELGI